MNFSQYWWKYICVILLGYVVWFGLRTPLKPGIFDIRPEKALAGQSVELNITGYNTNYTNNEKVYIKSSSDQLIEAKDVKADDATHLMAKFDIPEFIPGKQKLDQFSVITSSAIDGSSVLPSKLIIKQDSINEEQASLLWSSTKPELFGIKKYTFPFRNILYETIRNTFFHVSLWFAMFALLGMSVYRSIRYLLNSNLDEDQMAYSQVRTAFLFGVLGLITGSVWARYTWGSWWTNDIKLNMAALSMLIYTAYLILRAGIEDPDKKARISSSYNVFALVAVIPLIFVLPRLMDSLHPGNGGNPAFGSDDMDNSLRMVFYPSVIGFILLGIWLSQLLYRTDKLVERAENAEN